MARKNVVLNTDDLDDFDVTEEDDEEEEIVFNQSTGKKSKIGYYTEKNKSEKDPWEDLAEKFERVKHLWDTGMVKVEVRRVLPEKDAEGNHISGGIETVEREVDMQWIRSHYGGGTYQVSIKGPPDDPSKPENRNRILYLQKSKYLPVGGAPLINNGFTRTGGRAVDEPIKQEAQRSVQEETYQQMLNSQMELLKEEKERAAYLQQRMLDEKRSEESKTIELLKEFMLSGKDAARGQESNLIELFKSMNSRQPDAGASLAQFQGMLEAARTDARAQMDGVRRDSDRRVEAIEKELEKARIAHETERRDLQERHRDSEKVMREEYDRRLYDLKEAQDKRERDIREDANRREQTLRDEFDRREKYLLDQARREEKVLREQIQEYKDQLRTLEGKSDQAYREMNEAKYKAMAAETKADMIIANRKPFTEELANITEVAGVLGLSRADGTDNTLSQVAAILNTDAVAQVGARLGAAVQALASRGAGAQNPQMPVADSNLAAWQQQQAVLQQQAIQQQQAQSGPVRHSRRRRVGGTGEQAASPQEAAETLQEGLTAEEEQIRTQLRGLCHLTEEHAEAGRTPEEFLEELRLTVGAEQVDQFIGNIVQMEPEDAIRGLEELADVQMSIGAKGLLRATLMKVRAEMTPVGEGRQSA